MATTVSSLVVEIGSNIRGLTRGLNNADKEVKGFTANVGASLKTLGGGAMELGGALSTVAAPFVAGLGLAVNSAMEFDEAMTNVGAVLGNSHDEMAGLSAEILAIGSNTRAGPQAVADAFYDIVGGVADASTHMAILDAAIATSEAGNADLTATTSALVSVMNAYSLSADEAGMVSDVLTRTVGMGVGTMDEFASALPKLTGLASSVGISFSDVGASMAFMTTKGFTASESASRLQQAIISVLNPNADMVEALHLAGIESGSAALAQYGLAGTLGRVEIALGGNKDAMAAAMGSTEALAAATALNGEGFEEFLGTFEDYTEGATAAARAIQMESAAAQFDLLKSSVSGLGITVGNALLPSLNKITAGVQPIVDSFAAWAAENPELVTQIAQITLVVGGLGIGLVGLGSVLSAAGTIVGVAGTAFTAFGAVVAAVGWPVIALGGAIGLLIGVLNDPRIQEGLAAWTGVFDQIGIIGTYVFTDVIGPAVDSVVMKLSGIWDGVKSGIASFTEGMSIAFDWIKTNVIDPVKTAIEGVVSALNSLTSGLGAYGGAASNLGAALGAGASPGDFLSALGTAIGQELGIPGAATGANINSDGLVYAHAGERILNAAETDSYEGRGGSGGGGGGGTVNIYGVQDIEAILAELRRQGIDLQALAGR